MRKIWKVIFIVFSVLFISGLLCGAFGWFFGGTVDNLLENKEAVFILDLLSPQKILNNIHQILGL